MNTETTAADDGSNSAQLGGFPVTVNAPVENVTAGTDITVDVRVSQITNAMQVISWQADILFDPAVLLPVPVGAATIQGTIGQTNGSLVFNPNRSGKIKMSYTNPFGLCLWHTVSERKHSG